MVICNRGAPQHQRKQHVQGSRLSLTLNGDDVIRHVKRGCVPEERHSGGARFVQIAQRRDEYRRWRRLGLEIQHGKLSWCCSAGRHWDEPSSDCYQCHHGGYTGHHTVPTHAERVCGAAKLAVRCCVRHTDGQTWRMLNAREERHEEHAGVDADLTSPHTAPCARDARVKRLLRVACVCAVPRKPASDNDCGT